MTDARDVNTGRENVERWAKRLDYGAWDDCAELLRALVTERDKTERLRELLSGALDEAQAERDEARAEVERMRAALQPLASFAAHHPTTRQYGNLATSGEVWRMSSHGLPDAVLTVEDFHVAAALSAPAAKGGEDE
jgi:hypothetical protein